MYRTSSSSQDQPGPLLTPVACALCVIVFVGFNLQGADADWASLSRWGYLPTDAIWDGAPWALLSSVFVHLELWHIAFNVYWLWILGSCLENSIGWVRWLLFFVAAAWASSAMQLLSSGDTGIGMSGVGYALFGFAWVARKQIPEFDHILDDRTVYIFVLWLLGCIVLTQLDIVQIGNGAHVGGLMFGAVVAAVFVLRRHLWLTVPALVALIGISFVPLFWCPLSMEWNSRQASEAQEREDYATAITYYRRSLQLGAEPAWVWHNLALIYGCDGDKKEYAAALQELRKRAPKEATEVESACGSPAASRQP